MDKINNKKIWTKKIGSICQRNTTRIALEITEKKTEASINIIKQIIENKLKEKKGNVPRDNNFILSLTVYKIGLPTTNPVYLCFSFSNSNSLLGREHFIIISVRYLLLIFRYCLYGRTYSQALVYFISGGQ